MPEPITAKQLKFLNDLEPAEFHEHLSKAEAYFALSKLLRSKGILKPFVKGKVLKCLRKYHVWRKMIKRKDLIVMYCSQCGRHKAVRFTVVIDASGDPIVVRKQVRLLKPLGNKEAC